ncbi:MAG: hypothetical protein NTV82_01190 [Candidatus Aminicenantes bacterium]|nr:hypothetical protein [Candidatus Aminicenantes bacterium]
MKKIKSFAFLSLIILLSLGAASALAQDRFQAGGHFMLGFPQNEFKQNVENTGLGGNFYFAYRFPRSFLSAGISFGFLIYGSERREEPLSLTIPDLIVDVRTTNSILLCHLFFRLQPPQGRFRPYLDGLLGLNYLTTDTSIEEHGDWEDDQISSNNFNDFALSYGMGGGVMVSLVEFRRVGSGRRVVSLDLDIGARYLKGGEAEYLKKGSVHREDGVVTYDVYRSRTDLVKVNIGITFSF